MKNPDHVRRPGANTFQKTPAHSGAVHRRTGSLARSSITFRNRRGEQVVPQAVGATEAKSEFGRVLDIALQDGAVVITRHETPKAVLLSVDEFHALASAGEAKLDTLSSEFDALLARMQTPRARHGLKEAFRAKPSQLGMAALAVAKKRG